MAKWKARQIDERKRQDSGTVEERLIYYADFYDLGTILKKHWATHFTQVFGDLKTMEVWLSQLEKFRDPDAHRRELLPHQKRLVLGIAGEIRTQLVRYRSKQETSEDYFPKLESVRDNYGNIWTPSRPKAISTAVILRPGDSIDFVVTATDPKGEALDYKASESSSFLRDDLWGLSNCLTFQITDAHVAEKFFVRIGIRSKRKYHAKQKYDADVSFGYQVLPPKE